MLFYHLCAVVRATKGLANLKCTKFQDIPEISVMIFVEYSSLVLEVSLRPFCR